MSLTKVSFAMISGGSVSVFDFMTQAERNGCVDASVDVTAACNAAINYGIANGANVFFPYGEYFVTQLTVASTAYQFNIDCAGAIFYGRSTTPVNGIFDIVNCVDFSMTGSYRFQVEQPANYASALRIRAQAGTSQAAKWLSFTTMTFLYCPVAIYIGDKTLSYAVSEINFFAMKFRFCPIPVRLGGTQTGASFVGCDLTAEHIPPQTYLDATYPEHSVWMEGGFIKVVGGSLVTDITDDPQILLNPSNDADGNNYPTFIATGVHIESNLAQLAFISNPLALATPNSTSACLILNSCTGFAGTDTAQDYIACIDSTYAGLISVTDCNFYAAIPRTAFNIASASSLIKVKVDKVSFGTNFKDYLNGISTIVVTKDNTYPIRNIGYDVNNVTSSSSIYTQLVTGSRGSLVVVQGDDGVSYFVELVAFGNSGSAVVVGGGTVFGPNVARTYSVVGDTLKLTMASSSFTIRVAPFEFT
jgi:hypothetical protein